MDKKVLEMAKEVIHYLKRKDHYKTDKINFQMQIEALQSLIAHAEKAPVKWFNEQATEEAFILDLMFATGCRTENIIANNQMRKRIKDVLTAYQEAAKGEKKGKNGI